MLARRLLIASSLALSLTACGDPVEPVGAASVRASWEVLPRGCDAGDVAQVELRFERAGKIAASASFPCEQGEGVVMELDPGRYLLSAHGVNALGDVTFSSPEQQLAAHAERTSELAAPLRLSARPAEVEILWRFEDGRVCGAHGVRHVRASLFDGQDFLVAQQSFGCDQGRGVVPEVPAGAYTVLLEARGEQGDLVGLTDTNLKRGGRGLADVVLAPAR